MENVLASKKTAYEPLRFISGILLGCGLITLCSLIKIPYYPVPFTLQTFAIVFLGLTQSPKQAFSSALCYLIFATMGFPVLCGVSNPLWILGKCGGYLVAFPIAAHVIAKSRERFSATIAVSLGQVLIYFFGFLWLFPLLGIKAALLKGVLLFIPSDLLKNLAALSLTSQTRKK